MVDFIDSLVIMFQQELTSYRTEDYLDPAYQARLSSPSFRVDQDKTSTHALPSTSGISDSWREKICEWSYQVIDHFEFSREVVSTSINYLDRYLASCSVNKKTFQLAAMTSLYLSIKLFEPGRLSMSSMIELSRGYFTVEQMISMETTILKSLNWHVHPPTAYSFCKHILFLLPYKLLSNDMRHDILELARFLTELSVIDYFFTIHRPSVVAYAALINSMEIIPGAYAAIPHITTEVEVFCHLHPDNLSFRECRTRLRILFDRGEYSRPSSASTRAEVVSPVCVSHGCYPQVEYSVNHSDVY